MQHLSNLSDLGREVARLRKEQGMTQKELGGLAGIGQSTLARFETGGVAEFGAAKLLRLLGALGHGLAAVPAVREYTLEHALEEKMAQASRPDVGRRP